MLRDVSEPHAALQTHAEKGTRVRTEMTFDHFAMSQKSGAVLIHGIRFVPFCIAHGTTAESIESKFKIYPVRAHSLQVLSHLDGLCIFASIQQLL